MQWGVADLAVCIRRRIQEGTHRTVHHPVAHLTFTILVRPFSLISLLFDLHLGTFIEKRFLLLAVLAQLIGLHGRRLVDSVKGPRVLHFVEDIELVVNLTPRQIWLELCEKELLFAFGNQGLESGR